MSLVRWTDESGFPHVSQVAGEDTPPNEGLIVSAPLRYYLMGLFGIPLDRAVTIARYLHERNMLYDHDLINSAYRDHLFHAFTTAAFTREQAKQFSTGLVKHIRQGDNR